MRQFSAILITASLISLGLLSVSWAEGDLAKGKTSYEKLCASCHGTSGKGDGPASAKLKVKPRDHTDKKAMLDYSEEALFKVIKTGGASIGKSALMPPFGKALKDDQIQDLAVYVRSLSKQ